MRLVYIIVGLLMAGLLDILPAGGTSLLSDVAPPWWREQDVLTRGGNGPLTSGGVPGSLRSLPGGYTVNPAALQARTPSANVEDRRYMTSKYNPFMSAADHMTRGYYLSPEQKALLLSIMQLREEARQRTTGQAAHR
jgi:hypothetical protein